MTRQGNEFYPYFYINVDAFYYRLYLDILLIGLEDKLNY